MSFLATPLGFTPEEFKTYVAELKWAKGWKPHFATVHNTAEPNLKQWAHGNTGKDYELQRIKNLNHYYKGMGWHSGPANFISPNFIWQACDPEQDGVSVSCWNRITYAIEMVGDYSEEDFSTGDGAKVRDNAVAALAILHKTLGLKPDGFKLGVSGIHFHKECVKDHHLCPGKNVDKPDFVKRVIAEMAKI